MKNKLGEKGSDKLGPRNRAFLRFNEIESIKNKKVLDIGCGFGWLEYQLQNSVLKITGIDSDQMIIKNNQKLRHSNRVIFKKASALKMPFEDNSFEVVISSEVIEHLPKGSENIFFKEIYRVLKNNGVCFISTPNKNIASMIFDPAWYFGHRHYRAKQLIEIASKNGLTLNKYKVTGSWWTMLGLINMYISKWVFGRKKFFNSFFENKEDKESLKSGFMNLFISFQKKIR